MKINRPIVTFTLGAILGILCGLKTEINIILIFIVIFLVYKLIKLILIKLGLKKEYRYLKLINKKAISIFVISAIIFNIYVLYLNGKYETFYSKVENEIELEAIVLSNKKESDYYNSYLAKGNRKEFKNKKFIVYVSKKTELKYGDKIIISGEFYIPDESRNFKGFNYKNYLQTEKIYGTIKADKVQIVSKDNINFIFKVSNGIRNRIIKQIKLILPNETSGLLAGLLLGEKTNISKDIIEVFQKSSLAHILAVSGAHVSYIILGLTYFILISKTPKKIGYIFIILILIIFSFITNFSVSVTRACIMSIIFIFSKICYRKMDSKTTISIPLLISLFSNPYIIRSLSFQLSYLGTIGVIFISPVLAKILMQYIKKCPQIIKAISVTISAQIAILPIIIINFHTISLTFVFSNLIAMPILAVSIILGFILILVSFVYLKFAKMFGIFLNIILKFLILIAKFTATFKLSNIYVSTPSIATVIIYYILVLIVSYYFYLKFFKTLKKRERKFLKIGKYKKIILLTLIFILIIEFPYSNYNGKLKIYFIDVGQR